MFRRPCPRLSASSTKPSPSSTIRTTRWPSRRPISTVARRALAWRRTFARPSWTIRKISICSSGPSSTRALDLEVDVELAVGGEELDVAVERRVERRRASRRREREHGEPGLLLRGVRRLPEPRHDTARRVGAAGQQARLRRHGEQVLREAVVDLARDPCALLRDHAPDLGRADRAPDADEQDRVGEEPQEVALRHVLARERRREHRLELGEQPDRRAEGEPAVEVLAVRAVAEAEADERDQAEDGLERDRAGQQIGAAVRPGRAAAASSDPAADHPERPHERAEQGDGQEGGNAPSRSARS